MGWGGGGWSNARGNQPGWLQRTPQQAGMQQALDVATGWNAPTLIQNDISASRLANQLGYGDAQYQLGVDQLQQNTALDRARLGLAGNNIGVDRNALNRQIGVNDQLQGLAQQLFGMDIQSLGLQNAGIGIDRQSLAAQLLTDFRGLDNDKRGLLSQKTGMGSVGSVAHRRGNNEIQAQREDTYGQFGRESAGLDLAQDKVGLDAARVGLNRQQSDIEFGENKAKLQDRMKLLDTEAGKLGIDAKQLEANLSQGLARLGVDRLFGMNDLLDAMQSNDVERQAIAQQIFREAMGMSSFFEGNVGGGKVTTPSTSTSSTGASGLSGGFSGGGSSRLTGGGSW